MWWKWRLADVAAVVGVLLLVGAVVLAVRAQGVKAVAYDGCRVTGSQVIPNATPTTVNFTGFDFDGGTPPYWLNGAGQPQTVRVLFAGMHRLSANAWSAGGTVSVAVFVNGTAVAMPKGAGWSDVLKLNASDQITLQLYQSTGAPLNCSYSLSVHFEGP